MSSEYISFHFVSFHSIPKAALQDKYSSVKDAVVTSFWEKSTREAKISSF